MEFDTLYKYLQEKSAHQMKIKYMVPDILIGGTSSRHLVDVGNPYSFFLAVMDKILDLSRRYNDIADDQRCNTGGLSSVDVVYQSYIRTFASLNSEIGTPFKQIAFLPFLRERLGITVFISLPTGAIGSTNKKGRRGSPFAIKNPFTIDESLADPILPEFSALFQYKVLVQACHKLKIRTGSIVPLATLSIDCPLFKAFPALGFWWRSELGELLFCDKQDKSTSMKAPHVYTPPEISDDARQRFVPAPLADSVNTYIHNGQSYYAVTHEHQGVRETITLANSFPDIVADDSNTYTWSDVSTVNYTDRLYPLPMGIRIPELYDTSKPAWRIMPYIIAWRAKELGEEIFMVDVNPSVPDRILSRAQQLVSVWNDDLALVAKALVSGDTDVKATTELLEFLDISLQHADVTNSISGNDRLYYIGEELWSFDSPSKMIRSVVGPLIFCVSAHTYNHEVFTHSLAYHLKMLEIRKSDNLFLAGVSNHDTIPPSPYLSPLLYTVYYYLPNAVPLIFSGSEFYAQSITNKEFGFDTSSELLSLRRQLHNEELGLFNDCPLDWVSLPDCDDSGCEFVDMCDLIGKLNHLRQQMNQLDLSGYRFAQPAPQGANCSGYIRFAPGLDDAIVVLANWDLAVPCWFSWPYNDAELVLSVNGQILPHSLKPDDRLSMPPLSAAIWATGQYRSRFQLTTTHPS